MKKILALVVLVLFVGAVGLAYFNIWEKPNSMRPTSLAEYRRLHSLPPSVPSPQPILTDAQKGIVSTRDVPQGAKEYRNEQYHFSLLYPNDLTVKDSIDQYSVLTVVFEKDDPNDPKGFEVYVQPYNLPQVTEERFKKDLPSGVRTNMQNITVAGATGAAFYSKDTNLGDTREVWFLHNGLLYEVTTLKPLEAWFRPIIQTWQFI